MPPRRRPARQRTTTRLRHDTFRAVTRDNVTDLALLPHRFEQHCSQVKTMFELLTTRLSTIADRIEGKLDQLLDRTTNLERDQRRTEARVDTIEMRAANGKAD